MRQSVRRPVRLRALLAGMALLSVAGKCVSAAPIPHGTLELIADAPSVVAGQTFDLGLRFQLEQGWHIYWTNPGDSGEPPRVTWELPAGITAGAIEWPVPRRLGSASVVDFGYQDAVILIVPIRAAAGLKAQQSAQLGAEVKVLVCRELCVPGKAQLSLTLPIAVQAPTADPRNNALFAAARGALPSAVPKNWKLSVVEANGAFVLAASLGRQIAQATFFPLAESQIDNAAPQTIMPVATGFRLTLRKSQQLLKPLDRLKGVLVVSGGLAYAIDVPLGKAGAARNSSSGTPAKNS